MIEVDNQTDEVVAGPTDATMGGVAEALKRGNDAAVYHPGNRRARRQAEAMNRRGVKHKIIVALRDRAVTLEAEIAGLARVLVEEFGGPAQDESACEMAVRVLLNQRSIIGKLKQAVEGSMGGIGMLDDRGQGQDHGRV